jgi:hypothetical protein
MAASSLEPRGAAGLDQLVRFDFDRDREGDLAMLDALRAGLRRPGPVRQADPALDDRLRHALQLLGEDL